MYRKRRINLKAKWLCSIFAASALVVPAFSQIQVYIGPPPPPIRYDVRPPMPAEGYAWVDGYWGQRSGRYVWFPGRWQQPPYAGAYWTHPHYDHYQQGWQMHEGHWDREDHGDHHDRGHDDHHDHNE
jgi:hypothetical protein